MSKLIYDKWMKLENMCEKLSISKIHIEKVYTANNQNLYFSIDSNATRKIHIEFSIGTLANLTIKQINGINFKIERLDSLSTKGEFLTIELEEIKLNEIFLSFSITIYNILVDSNNPKEIIGHVINAITMYREFFSNKAIQLSKIAEQGLVGELLFLKELIDTFDEDYVTYWLGPSKNKRDFELPSKNGYEIKSTRNQFERIVHISNENQLDYSSLNNLYLVLYQFDINDNGVTLNEICLELLSKLSKIENTLIFKSNLLSMGVFLAEYTPLQKYKFEYKYIYRVTDTFPKITKSNLDPNISMVKYKINLNNIKDVTYHGATFSIK